MVERTRKVVINRGAVQELAVHGPVDRVEALFRETHRTLKRLKMTADGAKALGEPPRFEGGRPGIHDIKRWLDDLRVPGETEGDEVTANLTKDIRWLKRLHVTVRARSHKSVIEETEKDD